MKYKAIKTRYKWAEIYKYKSQFIIKDKDSLFYEISDPSFSTYTLIGNGYKNIDECIEQAIIGKEEFLNNNIIIM